MFTHHHDPTLGLILLALAACHESDRASNSAGAGATSDAAAPLDAAPAPPDHEVSDALRACAEAGGAVATVDDVVARFNVLPSPSAACLVASLQRPFGVVATSATLSAQPAASKTSPRIFLLSPGLTLSVVPEGDGASRVELGQWVTATRTLKAEIKLPFSPPLRVEQAFDHLLYGAEQTACSLCHRHEAPSPAMAGTFVSDAYRPLPSTLVPLAALELEHRGCVGSGDTSQRCAMFHALFDFGPVRADAFADEVALFTEE
jgi:hypothetical protein